jgi:hypothetical protein
MTPKNPNPNPNPIRELSKQASRALMQLINAQDAWKKAEALEHAAKAEMYDRLGYALNDNPKAARSLANTITRWRNGNGRRSSQVVALPLEDLWNNALPPAAKKKPRRKRGRR